MKKIALTLIMIVVALQMWGQTYDTVYNRSAELYYSEWYDTTLVFMDSGRPSCLYCDPPFGRIDRFYSAFSDYTSRPLMVRGLALMHTIDYNLYCINRNNIRCSDTTRIPEYISLYQGDGDSLIWLATARWDTAKPQVLKLPREHDTSRGFEYCYLYRVYFDSPIIVDSVFYIAGSWYNNYYPVSIYQHLPTYYVRIGRQTTMYDAYWSYPRYHNRIYWGDSEKGPWYQDVNYFNWYYGPFFAIAPGYSCQLDLHTSDSAMGRVEGGGWYLDSSYITISAVATRGHRFTQWDDGDRSNPRTVLLVCDTSFTAYFEEAYYTVQTAADPEQGGTVTGDGTYRGNDIATLTVRPNEGYTFVGWDDGDMTQTRQLEVTQDTLFTAHFRTTQGIDATGIDGIGFTLTPNPTRGTVLVELVGAAVKDGGTVTVTDATGKTVLKVGMMSDRQQLDISDLPAGTYFVTLATTDGASTQRLVIN